MLGSPLGMPRRPCARAGLCPGLDRSFGCEVELIGLVVAQEPVAGSDLARNGLVTLYVAAPGSGPIDEQPDASEAPEPAAATAVADIASSDAPRRVQRRKLGLARGATGEFDLPPAPVPLARVPAQEVSLAPECGSPDADDTLAVEELHQDRLQERGEAELSYEEFVVHLDDVLAGYTGGAPAWRRVYPRRHTFAASAIGGGVRAWLGGHPLLVKALGAVLAVWIYSGSRPRWIANTPAPSSRASSHLAAGPRERTRHRRLAR